MQQGLRNSLSGALCGPVAAPRLPIRIRRTVLSYAALTRRRDRLASAVPTATSPLHLSKSRREVSWGETGETFDSRFTASFEAGGFAGSEAIRTRANQAGTGLFCATVWGIAKASLF